MASEDVIIVGAGPAGVTAAVQCLRLGVRPLILDEEGRAGGLVANGVRVENYPGLEGPVDGQTLARRFAEHLTQFGLSVRKGLVQRIQPIPDSGFEVTTLDGIFHCENVIYSGGTRPIPLSFDGSVLLTRDVRLLYDVRPFLQGHLPWPKTAAIVGGGEAALDYALTLAEHNCDVNVLVRAEHPVANSRLQAGVDAHVRIATHLRTTLLRATCHGDTLSLDCEKRDRISNVAGERQTFSAERILVAIGRKSRVSEVCHVNTTDAGGIPLTPLPGLFICGDARLGGLGQVGIAVGDGLTAAMMIHHRLSKRGGVR